MTRPDSIESGDNPCARMIAAGLMALALCTATAASPQAAPDAGSTAPTALDPALLPEIVARVNGRELTRAELLQEAQGAYSQLRQMGQEVVADRLFYQQALQQLIAAQLIAQEARARGVAATTDEINQSLLQARAAAPSEEAFQEALKNQGTTEEQLRERFARDISRGHYVDAEIAPKVNIGDEEMRLFYDQNVERFRQPERVRVRHILIVAERDATADEKAVARGKAVALLERAKQGEDFAALAYEHSEDSSKTQGGELPWLVRGQTLPAFESTAFALAPGEISNLVETPVGFHIVKGIDTQASRIASFDEAKETIGQVLSSQKVQGLLLEQVDEFLARAEVETFLPE